MSAYLRPTPRPSLNEPLQNLYYGISTRSPGGAPNFGAGIRSQVLGRNVNTMAWGLSYRAGSPNYQTTNTFQDTQYNRAFQPTEFAVFRPGNNTLGNRYNTSFNDYAQQYAQNAYGHDTTPYSY